MRQVIATVVQLLGFALGAVAAFRVDATLGLAVVAVECVVVGVVAEH